MSRLARDRYQFDQSLFSTTGNVIFANFYAARLFAQKINQKRDLINFPEQAMRAGQINALGLIDEILHYVMHQYREQKNPSALQQALAWLDDRLGRGKVDAALTKFADEFPPLTVYRREQSLADYLADQTGGTPNREVVLEELLMLWLSNLNPACAPFLELFDDAQLEKETVYLNVMSSLRDFFETQPKFGPDNQNVIDLLRAPALANPHSLSAQLEYILKRWSLLLGQYLYRLLGGLDLIKEEEKMIFIGTQPMRVPMFGEAGLRGTGAEAEPERFSPDQDWMPRLVLIAKNAYVWLDQLSKKHQRAISRLDQIPDEELDQLARWGFTGLWLIGLWERSPASRRIKQMMGNPEAVASAYSLFDYRIADDLGGESALTNLKDRSRQHGIRLASDMVPNHMGIDSPWVINHPDWFIALDQAPYPAYSFNTPDVSADDRVAIQIEDHYFDKSDAAVVFKRTDKWTGSAKYIYHGNDGTSFPWNDTAQLNYLNPEVREAVIQTILHVARQFPIIRFDAAMTLAKKHFQRLWYPEPGSGGAIPSRAEYGLTKDQFDQLMPYEFWREVVDRAAAEAPDTLLLAEAFWLMEGYFVRTLGMHRVYNSAFMNILRDEENAKYRNVMKNTLEFDPEIMKRYVNFMNNPDERTALDQFGRDDKYFGVCALLATLPGLPMFGHGQIEGFAEKYGMEYRRAYWDEQPDRSLIERHEREIFPLLHRRRVFAGVEHFLLYDFFTPAGRVDENVFAYSNRWGDERGLVVYHNKFADTRGWVKTSTAFSVKTGRGDERTLVQRNLGQGLGLHTSTDYFCIFRDHVTGLEYIRSSRELFEQGLYVELGAYKYQVFLDFREVQDDEWHQYAHLAAYLNGRGVPNIDETVREVFLQPVHQPLKELINAGWFDWLLDKRVTTARGQLDAEALRQADEKAQQLFGAIAQLLGGSGDARVLAGELRNELSIVLQLPVFANRFPLPKSRQYSSAVKYIQSNLIKPAAGSRRRRDDASKPADEKLIWGTLFSWSVVHALGKALGEADFALRSRTWIDEWLLGRIIAGALRDFGLEESAAWRAVGLIKLLTTHQRWFKPEATAYQVVQTLLNDSEVQQFLQVNRYQEVLWFNKETFEELLWWLDVIAAIELSLAAKDVPNAIVAAHEVIQQLQQAKEKSEYQVEKLMQLIKQPAPEGKPRRARRASAKAKSASKKKSAAGRTKGKATATRTKTKRPAAKRAATKK